MISEFVRRATAPRIWNKLALPGSFTVALLATLAWRLLGWDWLQPVLAAAVFGSFAMVVVDDVFRDRVPGTAPAWLRATGRWVLRNGGLIVFPAATVVGAIASYWLGWAWVIVLTVVLGVTTASEVAVLVIVWRSTTDRERRRKARAFGSAVVCLWFDLSATLMLTAALFQHPHSEGAGFLHWLIPMCAVAAIADHRLVRRRWASALTPD